MLLVVVFIILTVFSIFILEDKTFSIISIIGLIVSFTLAVINYNPSCTNYKITMYSSEGKVINQWNSEREPYYYRQYGYTFIDKLTNKEINISGNIVIEETK